MVGSGTLADMLFASPAVREAEHLLRHYGFAPDSGRGKGSHIVWKDARGRMFPLPQRDPLSLGVFHSLLRFLGLSKREYLTLRQRL